MKGLILAGGSGTRLWPLSSTSQPKQFLSLGDGQSLLQRTYRYFAGNEVVVVANRSHHKLVSSHVDCPVVIEPVAKSTAPAIALGMKYWLSHGLASEEDVCVVMPSDLYFDDHQMLIQTLSKAVEHAKTDESIVILGITPTHADVGYGYIHTNGAGCIHSVKAFVEKPDLVRAQALLDKEHCYWNAGVFIFKIKSMLTAFNNHLPPISHWMQSSYEQCLDTFSQLPSISIDYGVMEKLQGVSMIPYTSKWSDVGSWQRWDDALVKTPEKNHICGDAHLVDTTNCSIFGDDIITLGVQDLLIVKSEGKVFVCSKHDVDRIDQLKKIVSD